MSKNPYSDLPKSAFWRTGVAQQNTHNFEALYHKKFDISARDKIATAGSCFAQHISHNLKSNGYNVLDLEPPPRGLSRELNQNHGFSLYSARYGNIYTVKQLMQLALEVAGYRQPQGWIWEKHGKYYDALRPSIEPEGLDSIDEVIEHRRHHISRVKKLFKKLDLFIFTLGLTEMWSHKPSGTIFPTAPGVIAGKFEKSIYEFKNASYEEIVSDFNEFERVVKKIRKGKDFKIILTVSPVPLTATYTKAHILVANTHSKSILRSAAAQLSTSNNIDYFPSYEIVTNPKNILNAYNANLRSIKDETIELVMKHFFDQHPILKKRNVSHHLKRKNKPAKTQVRKDIQCEDILLEAFSK